MKESVPMPLSTLDAAGVCTYFGRIINGNTSLGPRGLGGHDISIKDPMDEKVIFEKDGGHIGVLAALIGLPASMFLWPLFMRGFAPRALEISAYIFPVSALFLFLLYRLRTSFRRKIVLDNHGLLVEDLSDCPISWSDIRDIRVVQQPMLRGPTANWLVLHLKDQRRFSSRFVQKANNLLLGGGAPVCNLTTYKGQPAAIRTAMLAKMGRGPNNASRGDR